MKNVAEMDAAQHAVEQACAQLQDPGMHRTASDVLLQFRNSPEALPACKHILERSHSDMARFQAAITLREAALREWPLMAPADRLALSSYILQLILRCSYEIIFTDSCDCLTSQLTDHLTSVVPRLCRASATSCPSRLTGMRTWGSG